MIESYSQKEIEDKIDQYVNGQLSSVEVEELWTELVQDEYYLDYLKSVANLKSVVEKRESQAKITKLKRFWSYAAAAVITLVIGVATVLNYSGTGDVRPVEKIELDYYRSNEGVIDDSRGSKIIRDAITMANTGRFDDAVSLLKKELDRTNDPEWVAELNLNLGSLYYNKGSYQESITYYKEVIEHEGQVDVLTLEKTYWYMGNAYFQLEQLKLAKAAIERTYELNGAYRRVAQSYLDALGP